MNDSDFQVRIIKVDVSRRRWWPLVAVWGTERAHMRWDVSDCRTIYGTAASDRTELTIN